jgi:hypothetical protein
MGGLEEVSNDTENRRLSKRQIPHKTTALFDLFAPLPPSSGQKADFHRQ